MMVMIPPSTWVNKSLHLNRHRAPIGVRKYPKHVYMYVDYVCVYIVIVVTSCAKQQTVRLFLRRRP